MVDIVFPFVDCNDTVWQQSYKQTRRNLDLPTSIDAVRFRQWDNLKYMLRGIAKYMPWVYNVHMIVSNPEQVPEWINQEKVHIVYHKDIIPKEFLPTFNSCTIEMFLKNIKGLSSKFIYSNDDIFPIAPIKEEDFYDGDRIKNKFRRDHGLNTQFKIVEHGTEKLVATYFKKKMEGDGFLKIPHTMNPLTKDILANTSKIFGLNMYNSCTPFRTEKNINQYIYSYFEYYNGNMVSEGREYSYFAINQRNLKKIIAAIKEGKFPTICLNDAVSFSDEEFEELKRQINEAFDEIFSEPCKYEKGVKCKEDDLIIQKGKNSLTFTIPFESELEKDFLLREIKRLYHMARRIH